MSFTNLKTSEAYKEAIVATTQGWEEIGLGFIEKIPTLGTSTVSRQLNTILYTVLKLNAEVKTLREEVAALKARFGDTTPEPDLSEITDKLKNLQIGGTRREQRGKIKVFRNPFDLLKELK